MLTELLQPQLGLFGVSMRFSCAQGPLTSPQNVVIINFTIMTSSASCWKHHKCLHDDVIDPCVSLLIIAPERAGSVPLRHRNLKTLLIKKIKLKILVTNFLILGTASERETSIDQEQI